MKRIRNNGVETSTPSRTLVNRYGNISSMKKKYWYFEELDDEQLGFNKKNLHRGMYWKEVNVTEMFLDRKKKGLRIFQIITQKK